VHSQIDKSGSKSFFDLLCENSFAKSALGADLSQRNVSDLVACSADDFDFDFVSLCAQERGNVIGLPESELRAAGSDAEFRGLV
jgi:hypothetical protein